MILIVILSAGFMAFAIGNEENADTRKSILQGGAVSYSHVVHEYGPSHKYAVHASPSSVATASSRRYSTTPLTPIQSTTAYNSPLGYTSQKPLSYSYSQPFTKSPASQGNVPHINSPTTPTHLHDRLKSMSLTPLPDISHQIVSSIAPSTKYNANYNFKIISKQVPFPVFQPYSFTAGKLPYSATLPVHVQTSYAVAVPKIYPLTDTKLIHYPVEVPISIPIAHSIPVVVPNQYVSPFYHTSKAVIGNDVNGNGDYSPLLFGHVNTGQNVLRNSEIPNYNELKGR